MLDTHSTARRRGRNLVFSFPYITCFLLALIWTSGAYSFGRDGVAPILNPSKKSNTEHGHIVLNLSRKVGTTVYKVKEVYACGSPFLDLPPGTNIVTVGMEFYNGGRRTVHISPKTFEIRTDAGGRFQSGREDINLNGGQRASCNLMYGLLNKDLRAHPKLVCQKMGISFDLPGEKLVSRYNP